MLLPQICNAQWREVFLLVAEMQRSGDSLILMMKQQIQNTFATQVELQRLLDWVNLRATKAAEELPYKLSALRAWYLSLNGFNLDEGVESFRKSGQATEVYYGVWLAKTLGLDEMLAVDLSEVQVLYSRLCGGLSLVANKNSTADLISLLDLLREWQIRGFKLLETRAKNRFTQEVYSLTLTTSTLLMVYCQLFCLSSHCYLS